MAAAGAGAVAGAARRLTAERQHLEQRLFERRGQSPDTAAASPESRPRTAPQGGTTPADAFAADVLRTDLSKISTKRRNQNFVKMAKQTERPDINPKYLYGHIAHNPKWDLTERSTPHTSQIHAKSAPRFAGSATGTTNAYWLSNTGVRTINQARNGVAPAIIRPNYTRGGRR